MNVEKNGEIPFFQLKVSDEQTTNTIGIIYKETNRHGRQITENGVCCGCYLTNTLFKHLTLTWIHQHRLT